MGYCDSKYKFSPPSSPRREAPRKARGSSRRSGQGTTVSDFHKGIVSTIVAGRGEDPMRQAIRAADLSTVKQNAVAGLGGARQLHQYGGEGKGVLLDPRGCDERGAVFNDRDDCLE